MIESKDILWYFTHEIEKLKETDLTCTIEGDEVIIRPAHWLDDSWAEVMDYVDAMDGEWVKDRRNSHWVFDIDMIDYRIEEEQWIEKNHSLMEWWLQQPDAEKARLIPLWNDTAKWRALTRDERAVMVREVKPS